MLLCYRFRFGSRTKTKFQILCRGLINFCFHLKFLRLPFDWQTPMGYSLAIALLYIFIFNAAFAAIPLIVSAIGVSFILISLTKDITNELAAINRSARRIKRNPSQIVKQFTRLVKIHSHSMQLTRDFSELAKMMCTILFAWGVIAICGTMLMLHMELVEYLNWVNLLGILKLLTIVSFLQIFSVKLRKTQCSFWCWSMKCFGQ